MIRSINWLGVILAVVVNQAVGMLFYGFLFKDRWIQLALDGVPPSDAAMSAGIWQGALLGLFQAFGLAWLISMIGARGFLRGAWVGLFVGFFFSCAILMQDVVYAQSPMELLSINAGYVLIWMTLAGAVIGGVRWPEKKA